MGATVTQAEFLDIILASMLPSYELVMNALTTSLEEVGKPLEADNIIRLLKSQYDRWKSSSISKEEQVSEGTLTKKVHIYTNCKKLDILLKHVEIKEVEKRPRTETKEKKAPKEKEERGI